MRNSAATASCGEEHTAQPRRRRAADGAAVPTLRRCTEHEPSAGENSVPERAAWQRREAMSAKWLCLRAELRASTRQAVCAAACTSHVYRSHEWALDDDDVRRQNGSLRPSQKSSGSAPATPHQFIAARSPPAANRIVPSPWAVTTATGSTRKWCGRLLVAGILTRRDGGETPPLSWVPSQSPPTSSRPRLPSWRCVRTVSDSL